MNTEKSTVGKLVGMIRACIKNGAPIAPHIARAPLDAKVEECQKAVTVLSGGSYCGKCQHEDHVQIRSFIETFRARIEELKCQS